MIRDPENYNKYKVVREIDTDDFISFLDKIMKTRGLFSIIYLIIFYSLIGLMIFQVYMICSGTTSISSGIIKISIGVLLGMLSIIPHELIHALIYRIYGAKNIQFYSNWRKTYFTTAVDKYVLSKHEFIGLALMPFISIFLVGILLIIITQHQFIIIPFLVIHTSLCKGDFAITNFIYNTDPIIEYIYTDMKEKKSYFISKKPNPN